MCCWCCVESRQAVGSGLSFGSARATILFAEAVAFVAVGRALLTFGSALQLAVVADSLYAISVILERGGGVLNVRCLHARRTKLLF